MTERLRRARSARGWSQSRLAREIEQYARRNALTVATTESLRIYVSEWENARRTISQPYNTILRGLLGMTDEELFGPVQPEPLAVDGYDELVSRIDAAHSINRTVVETLLNQTELLRTLDRQVGAPRLVDQMNAHLSTLTNALTFAVLPDARRPVAQALAGAATLAAWQALDVGAADRAWRHYELAKTAAYETGRLEFLVHAMGEQVYVLADAGKTDLAVQLLGEALRISGGQVPPRMAAWLLAAEAEFHAMNMDAASCHRSLDRAHKIMPPDDVLRDPGMPSIFLTKAHLTRWRGHALALLGEDQAVSDLYSALDAMDSTFTRAEAGLRCDLAQAHLVRGEYDDATNQLRAARQLANRTGSVRHRRRIGRLTGQM